MKNFLSIILLTFISMTLHAQEHMAFKNIPMDCKLESYVSKLETQGYTLITIQDNGAILSGSFAGKDDCTILVLCTSSSKMVWKVGVLLPENNSWSSLKSEYKTFKESYTTKYGKPQSYEYFSDPYYDGDGYELQAVRLGKCTYVSFYHTELGSISLKIDDDECISIMYEDGINANIWEEEKNQVVSNDI